MSAENNIQMTGNTGYTAWATMNAENGNNVANHTNMSGEDAKEALKLFKRSIHNAEVLDGNVFIRDNKLVRASYGSYHGIFASGMKTYTSSSTENKSVRDFLRTILTAYAETLEPNDKTYLKNLIETQLSSAYDEQPLMRRTIKLLVDAAESHDAGDTRNELAGKWGTTNWKKVGDNDIGVWMSKDHFKNMLNDGLKEAKKSIEKEYKNDATSISGRKKSLDLLFEHYLQLFDKSQTDGCLGAFVSTVMDPKSLAKQMLEQLDGRAFDEKLQGLPLSNTSNDENVFGLKDLSTRATEIQKGRNHVRSLKDRNVVTFKKDMEIEADVEKGLQQKLSSPQKKERKFIADLIMNADTEKALSFGSKGARVLACLYENADLFASICLKANNNENNKKPPLDNAGTISANYGDKILKTLKAFSPSFADELVNLAKTLCGKEYLDLADCKTLSNFKDKLFAKMDVIAQLVENADLENKINNDATTVVEKFADKVVSNLKEVCECKNKESDLAIIRQLAIKSCDYDKRRMIAFSIRNFRDTELPQNRDENLFSNGVAGFVRGMGVYANKLLQGFQMKNENAIFSEEHRDFYKVVKATLSDLPSIDKNLIFNQLEKSLKLGKPDSEIERIDITESLGSGSVAQTFRCTITLKATSNNINNNDGRQKNVVIKIFRPGILEEFNRQAGIIQDYIDKNLNGKEKESLKAELFSRKQSFPDEINPIKEMLNTLWGLKNFGQEPSQKDESVKKKIFNWVMPNGKNTSMEEINYVGSQSLVVKPEYCGDEHRKEITDAINDAKNDDEMMNVLNTYFLTSSMDCMLIECAEGKDLEKHKKAIKSDIKKIEIDMQAILYPNKNNIIQETEITPITKDSYKQLLERLMIPRNTQMKLKRSLLQLKYDFLEGALIKPEHSVHLDLHGNNTIFYNGVTVIDYGRHIKLSNEEAEALKSLIKLEIAPMNVDLGKTMAEVYRKLLKSELDTCTKKYNKEGLPQDAKEFYGKRLNELKEADNKINSEKGELTGSILEREFSLAFNRTKLEANNKGEQLSQLAVFKRMLENFAENGSPLPLPSAVSGFIDSYSRLDNALVDVQNSIKIIDEDIAKVTQSYEKKFVKDSIQKVSDLNIELVGWFEFGGKDNEGKPIIKALKNQNEDKSPCPKMFTYKFNFYWENAQNSQTPALKRRQHLNTLRHLIDAESKRLNQLINNWKNPITLKVPTEEKIELTAQEEELKDCQNALNALEEANKVVCEEIEMLKITCTSETLYESKQIDPKLIEVGNVNLNDMTLSRLPITAEDRLLLSYLKANGVNKLPDNLEKTYCQILVSTCDNWSNLLEITKPHSPDDFIKLLTQLEEYEINPSNIANLNSVKQTTFTISDFSIDGLDDNAEIDKTVFNYLYNIVKDDKTTIIANHLKYYDDFAPYKTCTIEDFLKNTKIIKIEKPTVRDLKLLISFYDPRIKKPSLSTVFDSNKMKEDLIKKYKEIARYGDIGLKQIAEFKDTVELTEKEFDDFYHTWNTYNEHLRPTYGQYLKLCEIHRQITFMMNIPADTNIFNSLNKMIGDAAKNKKLADDTEIVKWSKFWTNKDNKQQPTTYDCIKAIGFLHEFVKDNKDNENLPIELNSLYTNMLEWLQNKDNTTFTINATRIEPPTVGDLRNTLAEINRIVVASHTPMTITDELYNSLFGNIPKKTVTMKMVKTQLDSIIASKGYNQRLNTGAYAYDDANIGNNLFDDKESFKELFNKAKEYEIIEKNIHLPDEPTNKYVWEWNQFIQNTLGTQPHLDDDKTVIHNLFKDTNAQNNASELLNGTIKAFETKIYELLRSKQDKKEEGWLQKLNKSFDEKIKDIIVACKEKVTNAALKIVKKENTPMYVKNTPAFVKLREYLIEGNPNDALESGNPSIKKDFEKQDGAEQILFNCMFEDRSWENVNI